MARGVLPGTETRSCIQCDSTYSARMWAQKFCSIKCKNKNHYWRDRNKHNNWWKLWLKKKLQEQPNFYKSQYQKRKKSPTYRERMNKTARRGYRKLREDALSFYGGCCGCCGEKIYEFLAIDHINGGGSKHKKEIRGKAGNIYRWLKQNKYPSDFQVLCHNCNMAKGFYGRCPHSKI